MKFVQSLFILFFLTSQLSAFAQEQGIDHSVVRVYDKVDGRFYYPDVKIDELPPLVRNEWGVEYDTENDQRWRTLGQLGGSTIALDAFASISQALKDSELLIKTCNGIVELEGSSFCNVTDDLVSAVSEFKNELTQYYSVLRHLSQAIWEEIVTCKNPSVETGTLISFETSNEGAEKIFNDFDYLYSKFNKVAKKISKLNEMGLSRMGETLIHSGNGWTGLYHIGLAEVYRTKRDYWKDITTYELNYGDLLIELGIDSISCTSRKVRNPKSTVFNKEPAYIDEYSCKVVLYRKS